MEILDLPEIPNFNHTERENELCAKFDDPMGDLHNIALRLQADHGNTEFAKQIAEIHEKLMEGVMLALNGLELAEVMRQGFDLSLRAAKALRIVSNCDVFQFYAGATQEELLNDHGRIARYALEAFGTHLDPCPPKRWLLEMETPPELGEVFDLNIEDPVGDESKPIECYVVARQGKCVVVEENRYAQITKI